MSEMTLREVQLELQRRESEDPLSLTYKPHAMQVEAHRCRRPIHLVIGGNRSGKSWFGVAQALIYAIGRTAYGVVPKPPVVIWYVMPSLTMFRRTILPIFRRLVPQKEIRRFGKRDNVVYFHNGSEIHFLSADMKQRRLQGASVDLVIMDETPEEAVFQELQARVLDRHGRIIVIFCPIEEEEGHAKRIQWIKDQLLVPYNTGDRQDIDVTYMPVADRDGNPLVPHFTKDDIKRMEMQWPDPATRAARMYGEFMSRTGLVYRSYSNDVHMVEPFDVPDEFARWAICDPQYHRFAVLFFAADDKGFYYVTDEYFSQDAPLAHRAERMKLIIDPTGDRKKPIPLYVDSANPQDIAELNWHFQRIKAPIGAAALPFKKTIDGSILRVQAMLEPDDDRLYPKVTGLGDVTGSPRLLMFNRLHSSWKLGNRDIEGSRLLWEMQRLIWGSNGKPDKSSADGADCCDCLGYGCMIQATGAKPTESDAWMRKIPLADVVTWKAIHAADQRRQLLFRED
jgi:Terminase large subunit, T4likevirus-type, N-terminal